MKKIFTLLLSSFSFISFAQTSTVLLNKKQPLVFSSTGKGNIDQEISGMNSNTHFEISSMKKISVSDTTGQSYLLDLKTEKLKMTISVMGNEISKFDSDDEKDRQGSLSSIGDNLDESKKFILTNKGLCRSLDTAKKNTGPDKTDIVSQMMGQFIGNKSDEINIENYFLIFPSNIKLGDSWSDSSVTASGTSRYTFKWDSTSENIALVRTTIRNVTNSINEIMGMEASVSMTSDITELQKVDLSTGIVKYKSSTSYLKGNIDVMGMSIPVSGIIEVQTKLAGEK